MPAPKPRPARAVRVAPAVFAVVPAAPVVVAVPEGRVARVVNFKPAPARKAAPAIKLIMARKVSRAIVVPAVVAHVVGRAVVAVPVDPARVAAPMRMRALRPARSLARKSSPAIPLPQLAPMTKALRPRKVAPALAPVAAARVVVVGAAVAVALVSVAPARAVARVALAVKAAPPLRSIAARKPKENFRG